MLEASPEYNLIVTVRSPYWLRITASTAAARTWLERAAPAFGDLERVEHTEHAYNLFVDAIHDPQDVAQYLATQGCAAQGIEV